MTLNIDTMTASMMEFHRVGGSYTSPNMLRYTRLSISSKHSMAIQAQSHFHGYLSIHCIGNAVVSLLCKKLTDTSTRAHTPTLLLATSIKQCVAAMASIPLALCVPFWRLKRKNHSVLCWATGSTLFPPLHLAYLNEISIHHSHCVGRMKSDEEMLSAPVEY